MSRLCTPSTISFARPGNEKITSTTTTPVIRYAKLIAMTLTIGAKALGSACHSTMRIRGTPLSIAISIDGDVMTLSTALRVIRVIGASTARVSVRTGRNNARAIC